MDEEANSLVGFWGAGDEERGREERPEGGLRGNPQGTSPRPCRSPGAGTQVEQGQGRVSE